MSCELFVLIGDANPEYTPDEFFQFFETKQEADACRSDAPEVFGRRLYKILCPTCLMRESGDNAWKENYVCGFSDWLDDNFLKLNKFHVWTFSGIPLYVGARGKTLKNTEKFFNVAVDSREHNYSCPRCKLALGKV
jgi:hypothetical protein